MYLQHCPESPLRGQSLRRQHLSPQTHHFDFLVFLGLYFALIGNFLAYQENRTIQNLIYQSYELNEISLY